MSRRTERVNSLIRSTLSKILLEEVSDPALQDIMVTEVELSPDLKNARVFYSKTHFHESALKDAEIKKGLKRVNPFLRKQLAQELELRVVPELRFEEDTHSEDVNRIMHLLEEVKEGSHVS